MRLAGAATRMAAGGVVGVALLLQLLLVPPLMLRMASSIAPSLWPMSLCAATNTSGPTQFPEQPLPPHHHDMCPLCQSHPVPLGLVVAAVILICLIGRWVLAVWPRRCGHRPAVQFRPYSPRAPPVFG